MFRTAVPSAHLPALAPGLGLTAALAVIALCVHHWLPTASPAIIAAALGLGVSHTVKLPVSAAPGIGYATKTLLRLAVVLLGFQISAPQVVAVGLPGVAALAATLTASFVFITLMGRALKVEPRLTQLIAAGTSVCGAAAAVAGVNAVTRAEDEDVAYAVATVTLFGTALMLFYPLIGHGLSLTPQAYGYWTGASVHEVAQVIGAASPWGDTAVQSATVAKLTRVLMLAPLVTVLGFGRGEKGAGVPLFVIGFAVAVVAGSVVTLPGEVKAVAASLSAFLLAMALAGMGLRTHVRALSRKGAAPLILAALGALFIAIFGLGMTLFVA